MRKSALVCLCYMTALLLAYHAGAAAVFTLGTACSAVVLAFFRKRSAAVLCTVCLCAYFLGALQMTATVLYRRGVSERYGDRAQNVSVRVDRRIDGRRAFAHTLSTPEDFGVFITLPANADIEIGDVVTGYASFSPADSDYYFGNGAAARASFRSFTKTDGGGLYKLRSKTVGYVRTAFEKSLGELAPLASGMLLGDRENVTEDISGILYDGGLVHLLAVSGIHVGIIIFFVSGLMKLTRAPRALCAGVVTAVSVFYMLMAGFAPSVCRAAVMAAFSSYDFVFRRRMDPMTTLLLTGASMCLFNPSLIANTGFLLSVCATAGLTAATGNVVGRLTDHMKDKPLGNTVAYVLGSFFVSASAIAACMPVLSAYFGRQSALAPIANLVCAPLAEAFLLSAFVLAFVFPVPLIGSAVSLLCRASGSAFLHTADLVAASPLSLDISAPAVCAVSTLMLAVLLVSHLLPVGRKTEITVAFTLGISVIIFFSQIM